MPPHVPRSRCLSCGWKMISAFSLPTCRNPVYFRTAVAAQELFRQLAQVVDEGHPDMTFLTDRDRP